MDNLANTSSSNISSSNISVLLVDDHAVVRAGYTFLLENIEDINVVAEAASGEEAIAKFAELKPDIVVMDLSMPGMDGLEAIRTIRTSQPEARVLVFSMHEKTPFVERALQEGAAGYISKNSSPEMLISAIRQIACGEMYIDAQLAQNLVVQQTRTKGSHFAGLSSREFQILCLFAEAYSIESIAKKLSLSTKTIANYLSQIKDKLQVDSTPELVRLAISEGLVSV
ncbi:response regulator transcription factor [Gammaproteobacteria bacterium]|nr:response regulator transcription factor [Gammaproteobacteria bacterium]